MKNQTRYDSTRFFGLKKSQIKQVIDKISNSKQKIGIALKGQIPNGNSIVNVITQHYFIIFDIDEREILDLKKMHHLSGIKNIREDNGFFTIGFSNHFYSFSVDNTVEFFQTLFLHTNLVFIGKKQNQFPIISVSNKELTKQNLPKLSLSQCFQVYFWSLVEKQGLRYNHIPVNYFHFLVTVCSTLFNFNVLSKSCEPYVGCIIKAIESYPFIHGFYADGFLIPSLFQYLSHYIKNTNGCLKLLHFVNCGAKEEDFELLIESLAAQSLDSIQYIDFSENIIQKLGVLTKYLDSKKSHLYHLGLNKCQILKQDLVDLLKSLSNNNNTLCLKVLKIAGAQFSEPAIKVFDSFIEKSSKNGGIDYLDISEVQDYLPEVISILSKYEIPKKSLIINFVDFSRCNDSFREFLEKNHTLEYLSIRGTGPTKLVSNLIKAYGNSLPRRNKSLDLSQVILSDDDFLEVMSGLLLTNFAEWTSLKLNHSVISNKSKNVLLSFLSLCQNMENIELSGISTSIDPFLEGVLSLRSLRSISIPGLKGPFSNDDINCFIETVKKHENIKSLDISKSQFSEMDLGKICEMYSTSQMNGLNIDSVSISSTRVLHSFMQVLVKNRYSKVEFFNSRSTFGIINIDPNEIFSCYFDMFVRISSFRMQSSESIQIPEVVSQISPNIEFKSKSIGHKCLTNSSYLLEYDLPFPDQYMMADSSSNNNSFSSIINAELLNFKLESCDDELHSIHNQYITFKNIPILIKESNNSGDDSVLNTTCLPEINELVLYNGNGSLSDQSSGILPESNHSINYEEEASCEQVLAQPNEIDHSLIQDISLIQYNEDNIDSVKTHENDDKESITSIPSCFLNSYDENETEINGSISKLRKFESFRKEFPFEKESTDVSKGSNRYEEIHHFPDFIQIERVENPVSMDMVLKKTK